MTTTTDPTTRTYAETWAGRGVPMDELAAFVARAVDAGAPLTARIRLENVDRNVLLGLTAPGTRMSVTWPYHPSPAGPSLRAGAYDETERVIALEDARYRQERAKGGVVDPKTLAIVGEPATASIDVKTHADKTVITRAEALELGLTDPWPFKPGDALDGADGPWLDAAPEGTIVRTPSGDEWMNDGTKPGDEIPTWRRGRDRTSPGFAARIASSGLAKLGPLTVVRVGEDQNPPAEPWPFKPGDVVRDSGEEADHGAWVEAAPDDAVLADHKGNHWKRESSLGWHRTDVTPVTLLADGLTSHDLEKNYGPLTVVSVGTTR